MIIDEVNGQKVPRFLIYDIIKYEVTQFVFYLKHLSYTPFNMFQHINIRILVIISLITTILICRDRMLEEQILEQDYIV